MPSKRRKKTPILQKQFRLRNALHVDFFIKLTKQLHQFGSRRITLLRKIRFLGSIIKRMRIRPEIPQENTFILESISRNSGKFRSPPKAERFIFKFQDYFHFITNACLNSNKNRYVIPNQDELSRIMDNYTRATNDPEIRKCCCVEQRVVFSELKISGFIGQRVESKKTFLIFDFFGYKFRLYEDGVMNPLDRTYYLPTKYDSIISKIEEIKKKCYVTDKDLASYCINFINTGSFNKIKSQYYIDCIKTLIVLIQFIESQAIRYPGIDKWARSCLRKIQKGESTFKAEFNNTDGNFIVARGNGQVHFDTARRQNSKFESTEYLSDASDSECSFRRQKNPVTQLLI